MSLSLLSIKRQAGNRLDERRLLKTEEVAGLLEISQRTVCEWAECGCLPGFKVGRQWRFRAGRIQSWLNQREANFTAEVADAAEPIGA